MKNYVQFMKVYSTKLQSVKKIVSGIYRENGIVSGIDLEQQSKEGVLDRRVSILQVQAKHDLTTSSTI